MGGPACMADAECALAGARTVLDGGDQISDLSCTSVQFKRASRGKNRNTSGVIAAILKFPQAIKQYGSNVSAVLADVADDTAHEVGYPFLLRNHLYHLKNGISSLHH